VARSAEKAPVELVRASLARHAGLRGARHCGRRDFARRAECSPPRAPTGRAPRGEGGCGPSWRSTCPARLGRNLRHGG
jgi:hypothetical protein